MIPLGFAELKEMVLEKQLCNAERSMGLEPIKDISNMGDPPKVYSLDSWSLSQHE